MSCMYTKNTNIQMLVRRRMYPYPEIRIVDYLARRIVLEQLPEPVDCSPERVDWEPEADELSEEAVEAGTETKSECCR